jgi:hypothetical protein
MEDAELKRENAVRPTIGHEMRDFRPPISSRVV